MISRAKAIIGAVLIFTSAMQATNGTRMIGFDARTAGRGGAAIGLFDTPSLMMANPAGIAFLPGRSLDLQFSLLAPRLAFSNGVNNETGKDSYYPLPGLAYVNAGPACDLAWGVGAFTQGGMGSDFSMNHVLFRNTDGSFARQEYFSKLAVMQGGPSVALRLTPAFAVGASAHLMYSQMEFRMPYSLAPSIMRGVVNPGTGMTFGDMFSAPPAAGGFGYTEVTAAAAMTDLTAFGFGGKVGLAWKVSDRASLGLSYTSPTAFTYKNGTARMDMTAQLNDAFGRAVQGVLMQNPGMTPQDAQAAVMQMFGQLGIDLSQGVVADYDLEVKLTMPQSVGFGASFNLLDNARMAVDIEWINWKNAFDKMSLSLSSGSNTNINRMLGNAGAFSLDFPMNWEDAVMVRLGAEVDVTPSFTLRAGGAFGTNPVPSSTVFPVFPAIVENHVTVGASVKIVPSLAVHAAFEHALNKQQKASTPSILAEEYSGSISQLSENVFHLSLSWSLQ